MTFGERLAKARKQKKLTQDQLGAGLGTNGAAVHKTVVSGWENNLHFPRVDQLMLICEKLGCGADYLLTGRDSKWPFSIEYKRFTDLTERQQGIVEGELIAAIRRLEAPEPPPLESLGLHESKTRETGRGRKSA